MTASSVVPVGIWSEKRTWAPDAVELRLGPYLAKFAIGNDELAAALRLRFEVFNLELNEGLQSAYASGYDEDEFDDVCDHLIVKRLYPKNPDAILGIAPSAPMRRRLNQNVLIHEG